MIQFETWRRCTCSALSLGSVAVFIYQRTDFASVDWPGVAYAAILALLAIAWRPS